MHVGGYNKIFLGLNMQLHLLLLAHKESVENQNYLDSYSHAQLWDLFLYFYIV